MHSSEIRLLFPRLLSGALLIALVACSNQSSQSQYDIRDHSRDPYEPSIQSTNTKPITVIPTEILTNTGHTAWIPLKQVVEGLGLRQKETKDSIKIGFSDVMFQVQPGQNSAISNGRPITLSQAPIVQNGQVYLTAKSLSELLQTQVRVDSWTNSLQILPIDNYSSVEDTPQQTGQKFDILGIAENRNELVAYAKKFMGVPYEFGAAPYEQSKTFDCSTFTQHVFKRFGSSLPRLAREQAKEGTPVNRSDLVPGDLIFFTVKGRFESDKIPGHVGIYIGDGNFIHTWGDPGVQISPLDTGYWKDVTLFMRRIK